MKKIIIAIVLILAIAAGAYFGYRHLKEKQKIREEAARAEKIVLRVEDKVYTLADFERSVRLINPDNPEMPEEVLAELFTQFVEDRLILYSARKRGLELSPEEKEAFLRQMLRDYPVEEGLDKELASDPALEESLLVKKYKHEKIKDVTVTEEEIKKYYQENKKDFLVPERVKVSQILVKSSDEAVKLREQLLGAGEEKFRQAAREFSRSPDAYKGGLMGIFKPGELPWDMERVIFSLEEGQISSVFQSAYGYHLFRVDRKYPPTLMSLEEATPRIRNLLLEKKVKDIIEREIEEIKATYYWQVFPENLPFKYEGNKDDR